VRPPPRERHGRRRRRERPSHFGWALRAALIFLVFALGVALGEALHDNPSPGKTFTIERTVPLPSVPPGSTITP